MIKKVLFFFFLAVTISAAGLPLEWLLLTGGARDRLIDGLLLEERLDELDFLMSVWEGDEWSAEDLAGCVTAASASGTNGYPVALSALAAGCAVRLAGEG